MLKLEALRRRMVSSALASVIAATLVLAASGAGVSQAQETLKIGVILPLSGPAAGIGQENLNGIQYAVDEAGGQIAGKRIELVAADDQNSPNTGLSEVRRLVENEKVIAVVGSLNSAEALAIHPYTTRAEVPYVSGGIAADLTGARKSLYTFRASFAAGQVEAPLVQFLIRRGLKSGILLGSDYAAGHDAVNAVAANLKRLGGVVVDEIFPRPGETDYAPYFSRITGAKADFVFGFFFGGDVLRFVQQYRSFGIKLPLDITTAAIASAGVAQALGPSVDGILSAEQWVWTVDDPASKAFVEGYTKKFGVEPQEISVDGYIEGRSVIDGIKALNGKVANGTELAKAMQKDRFQIPGQEFRFDANNNPIVSLRLIQWVWQDGKAVPKILDTLQNIGQDGNPVP